MYFAVGKRCEKIKNGICAYFIPELSISLPVPELLSLDPR